jgi:hypothetical protein
MHVKKKGSRFLNTLERFHIYENVRNNMTGTTPTSMRTYSTEAETVKTVKIARYSNRVYQSLTDYSAG